jgi:oligopeptide transport system ATP-binding protein
MSNEPLLLVEGLSRHFPVEGGFFRRSTDVVKAVDRVDLTIGNGETVGLVGESGSGKTTLGRCILRLVEPTAGRVMFSGRDLRTCTPPEMRDVRRNMQIIFQDPHSSLNPRKTVRSIIGEGFRVHGLYSPNERRERVAELAALVGLAPDHLDRFPHEFSGGQKQRICIARAIALDPQFIVADEPVSALDVSIRAQILNLLVGLQDRLSLTYLFISHDLAVVRHICDRVGVMYMGRIVELAPVTELYSTPRHPYTQMLLAAVPKVRTGPKTRRSIVAGDIPSPVNPPSGCHFHPRCAYRQRRCEMEEPHLSAIGIAGQVACHFPLKAGTAAVEDAV